MNYSRFPLPDLQAWQAIAETFRRRLSQSQPMDSLERCIDQKFMMVQMLRSGLRPGSRYQSRTAEALLHDLADDLGELLSAMNLQLTFSCFGQDANRSFYEHDYLGIWCLIVEVATMIEPGSTIELNLGSLPHGVELEIGSDSHALEKSGLLRSDAWHFVSQLISVTRAMDLKCPLGGGAIQLDLVGPPPEQRQVA